MDTLRQFDQAIENGDRHRDFSHQAWLFSTAMLVRTRGQANNDSTSLWVKAEGLVGW